MMELSLNNLTERVALVVASAIAILLVILAIICAISLTTIDQPGLWDDLGAGGGLIASILGLFGMADQTIGRLTQNWKTQESVIDEANDAAIDLTRLECDLRLGSVFRAQLDMEATKNEVDRLLDKLDGNDATYRRLTVAFNDFKETVARPDSELT